MPDTLIDSKDKCYSLEYVIRSPALVVESAHLFINRRPVGPLLFGSQQVKCNLTGLTPLHS
jgi:hypothetical protein